MSSNGSRPKRARADWYADVMRLMSLGWTHRQIADELNISRKFVRDLLYDPDGSKTRARKERYRRPCADCGTLMSGSDGTGPNAPVRCAACSAARQSAELTIWTRDAIIIAIRRWADEHGRPPRATDWNPPPDGYPWFSAVYRTRSKPHRPFASWANAIEAADYPRPGIGTYDRTGEAGLGKAERYALARARRRPSSGVTTIMLADERHVSANATYQSLLKLERRGLLARDTSRIPHVYRPTSV